MTDLKQLCPCCFLDIPLKDFLGKVECYKCTVEKKRKSIVHVKKCKRCNDLLPSHRWKYCEDCAELGYKDTKRSWTDFVIAPTASWHMNFRSLR